LRVPRGKESQEDGPIAATALNKEAGGWLRRVREERKPRAWSAPQFATLLSDRLKIIVTAGALYSWETGTRTVPAAVMLAAAEVTARPIAMDGGARKLLIDELLDELERRRQEREGG
jgi:hypothetical protein